MLEGNFIILEGNFDDVPWNFGICSSPDYKWAEIRSLIFIDLVISLVGCFLY